MYSISMIMSLMDRGLIAVHGNTYRLTDAGRWKARATMSDFSDYPVGEERDIEIAKREGWRIEPPVQPDKPRFLTGPGVSLADTFWRGMPAKTDDEFWRAAWKAGYIPHRSTDTTAAWGLLMSLPDDYTPRIVRILAPRGGKMAYAVKAAIIENKTHEQWDVIRDDAADAMSQVWLEWEESM